MKLILIQTRTHGFLDATKPDCPPLPGLVHDLNTATKFAKLHSTHGWCYNRKSQIQGPHYDVSANLLADI